MIVDISHVHEQCMHAVNKKSNSTAK
jgi:hypothetical protein